MNQKLVIFFLLSLCAPKVYAQYSNKPRIYLDAIELARLYKLDKKKKYADNTKISDPYYQILSKYGISETDIQHNDFIRSLYILRKDTSEEKLLKKLMLQKGIQSNSSQVILDYIRESKIAPSTESIQEPPIAASINWEAAAINGLSNFMAGRFRQEVLHMAINQAFARIQNHKEKEFLTAFFPMTVDRIRELYNQGNAAYYNADLIQLKEVAKMDIDAIPEHIVLNSDKLIKDSIFNLDKKSVKDVLILSNSFMKNVRNGYSLDNLITVLASEIGMESRCTKNSNIYRILDLVDLLSQATLNRKNSETYWVSPQALFIKGNIKNASPEQRFFYALLFSELNKIKELNEFMGYKDSNDVQKCIIKMESLIEFVDELNKIHSYLKNNSYRLNTLTDFNTYLEFYFNALKAFSQKIYEIDERNILKATYILDPKLSNLCYHYFKVIDAVNSKNYQRVIPSLIAQFDQYFQIKDKKVYRTLSFLTELGMINSSADMERLLQAYTLPIGSASIKRHSKSNWSVNGYVGVTAGNEIVLGSANELKSLNIGLAAPIGIAYTWDQKYTVFGSIIDLGTIVNQRLSNDNTEYSNLKFQQFFAPGLGFYLNVIKNTPISFGVHVNYIPNLKNIQYSNGTATIIDQNSNVVRANLSFLIDIPFFTIYNRE